MSRKQMPDPGPPLEPPRFIAAGPLSLAGIKARHACGDKSGIAGQWERFTPWIGSVPGQKGQDAYGVVLDVDARDDFDYLCAVEVEEGRGKAPGLSTVTLPPQRYAVFRHPGSLAGIGAAWDHVWRVWARTSGHKVEAGPFFERYGEAFDPATGLGGFELWVPVRA